MKKKKEKEESIIGRIFEIILYNEDGPDYFDKLCKLENYCIDNNFTYYYITHDKDIYSDEDRQKYIANNEEEPTWKVGDIKEKHTHYLIYTNSKTTTTIDNISKECEIKPNKIKKKNYLVSSIKYLTHESTNSTDKALYDWHDILTNDNARVNKVYENLDENTYMREFINYIDENSNIIEYRQFVEFVLSKNLWSYYRRSASIIRLLIEEHNNKIKVKW